MEVFFFLPCMLTNQHQLSLSLFLIKHDRGALCRVYLNKVTNHRLAPVVVPPHACFPCTELCFSSGTAPQPHPGPVSKVPRRLPHVRLQLGALPCRDLTELQPPMKRMHLFTHTYFHYNKYLHDFGRKDGSCILSPFAMVF